MDLRDYQAGQLDRTRAKLREGNRRVLLQLPTGGGKTVMAATMLGGAGERGKVSWFLVHRKELIEQTSSTFRLAGIEHGVVGAGFPLAVDKRVQICGVQTLVNMLDIMPAPDMMVVDEAHHAVAGQWGTILSRYPNAWVLGLTATPERLDGQGLSDRFDCIVNGPATAELIARGFLSPYKYYAPGKPDLAGCKTTAGDFNRKDIGSVMDKPKLVGDVVEHYQRLAAGEQGVVFAASIAHSNHIAEAFVAAGVKAAHVDGKMSPKKRKKLVDGFRIREIDILVNVDLFGEGFDVPGIVYCGLARPTKSLPLYLQQVGRPLRIMEGKECAIICDHAGNAFTHGLPDDDRYWTLEGRKKRAQAAPNDDVFGVRQCLECYMVSRSGTSICPGCDTVFAVKSRAPTQEDGELFVLDSSTRRARDEQLKERLRKIAKQEERDCGSLKDLIALGQKRGYSNPSGWARGVWHRQRFYRGKVGRVA